ncbi:hypothetical protein [Cellvibrio fibrivorans]|uniref:Fibronectin type-III domain-containing protein n=1 Tax=Cellvibrio fibrivorans TaxID=126350 RepID=A0ABU1V3N2_9GAMM|nr:hypothetical protein [Cellvibrio fibrivorans]MDR7091987.1 hypothetical protein [Cellvibrio fibrivorans]
MAKSSVTEFVIYQWRVRACNSSNVCSAWTTTRKKTFPAIPVPSTTSLLSPTTGATEPLLPCFSWKVDPNALDATITVSTTTDFPEKRWQLNVGKDAEAACFSSSWLAKGLYPEEIGNPVLVNGTTYYWRIVTTMASGLAFTETRSFKASTAQPVPAQPATATLEADSVNNRFTINWSNVSAYKYELQYTGASDTVQIGTSWYAGPTLYSGTSTTVAKSSVTEFVIYQWRVRACNSSNVCSAWTTTRKKTFPAIPVPSTTSLLSPTTGATEPLLPCFSWKVDPNALDATITVSTTTDFPEKRWQLNVGKDAEAACFSSSWLAKGLYPEEIGNPVLVNGATYYWRIVTTMANGLAFTETRSFKASSVAQPVPAQPATATLDADSVNSRFTINWSNVSAYKYELQYTGASDTVQIGTNWYTGPTLYSGTSTTVAKSSVTEFVIYQWRVRACNSSNVCSAWTTTRKKTFPAIPVPSTTSLLSPTTGATEPLLPCFSWKVDPNALDATITVSTTTDFPEKRWQLNVGKDAEAACFSSSWLAKGVYPEEIGNPVLVNGATYYWRIVTTMANGYAFTETRSFKASSVAQPAPAQPAFASLETDSANNLFKISWASGAAYKYELQYSGEAPATFAGGQLNTTPIPLAAGGTQGWGQSFIQSINATGGTLKLNNADAVTGAIGVAGSGTTGAVDDEIQNGELLTLTFDAPVSDASFGFAKLDYNVAAGHQIGLWIAFLNGVEVGRSEFRPTDTTRTGTVQVKNTSGNFIAFDQIRFEPAKPGSDYVVTSFSAVRGATNAESVGTNWYTGPTLYSGTSTTVAKSSVTEFVIYQWRVRACNSSNVCSAWTTTRKKTFPAIPVPSTTSLLSPTTGATEPLLPCFSWKVDPNALDATITVSTTTDFPEKRWQLNVGKDAEAACFSSSWLAKGLYPEEIGNPVLVNGATYYWRIVTTMANGLAFTETRSFKADATAVGDLGFSVVANTLARSFTMKWKGIRNVHSYEFVYRNSDRLEDLDAASWTTFPEALSATQFASGTFESSMQHYEYTYIQWRLRVCMTAVDCVETMSKVKTNQQSAGVTSVAALTPTNNAQVDASDENAPCFTWSSDANASSYTLTLSDVPDFTERRWQKSNLKVTTACWDNAKDWVRSGVYRTQLPAGLEVGKTYYWRIVTNNNDGTLGFSNTNSFKLIRTAPQIEVAIDLPSSSFVLTWNEVPAEKYELQARYTNTVAEIENANWQGITLANPLTINHTEPFQKYQGYFYVQWQLRACQSANVCGAWQKSRIKTTQSGAVLSSINLTAPVNGSTVDVAIDQTVPCFKWSADEGATDYLVTVSDTTEFTEKRWVKSVVGATEICWNNGDGWSRAGIYKDELQQGLSRGFKYYWRVVSRYPNGNLGFSQTSSFEIKDSSVPVIALISPDPLEDARVFIGSNVPVMANVFDNYMRNWRNLDGRQPTVDYYLNNSILPGGTRVPAGTPVNWMTDKTGVYTLKAVAYLDDAKTLKTLEAEVHVVTPQAPTFAIQAIGSANAGSAIELIANVTDPDQQTAHVTFYANGEPVGKTSEAPPYKTRWTPTVAGNYVLTAKLIDKRSNETISAVKNAVVHPSLLSTDGLNFVSDFGDVANQSWRVMPLEQSDVLAVSLANTSRISYNKLGKLLINRPLKIINRSDMYDNEIVPQLIVLDAGQIELNSSIEIVGEPADLLILNATVSNAIRCKNCGFINVERAVLAVATPVSPLLSAMTQVGQLQTRAAGVIDVDNLQASGVVSLELIANTLSTKGQINTNLYANEEWVANSTVGTNTKELIVKDVASVESKVVGSGGVTLLQGFNTVNYETLEINNTKPASSVFNLQAFITSGAINIFTTDALQVSSGLSTQSSYRRAQTYRGQLRAQKEEIVLKSLSASTVAPAIAVNAGVHSDASVNLIAPSISIAKDAGIQASKIDIASDGTLSNIGYIRGYVASTPVRPAGGVPTIDLRVGNMDNRGEIKTLHNSLSADNKATELTVGEMRITSSGDVYNRFGGLLQAEKIAVESTNGKIRNGSLYRYDNSSKEAEAISQVTHQSLPMATHTTLSFPANQPPLNNIKARIIGVEVALKAKTSIENINPFTEPAATGSVLLTQVSERASQHIEDVSINARNKLGITAGGYILNSSALLGVAEAGVENALSLNSPRIRNERYYAALTMEKFSDYDQVQRQSSGNNISITNWAKGIQSRYTFYSPPGYIYSFAKAEMNFGDSNLADQGLINNLSYIDMYADLNIFGKGDITSRGLSLEKLAYEEGSTTVVSLSECISIPYHNGPLCSLPSSTYSKTPDGKIIKQSPDNTLFAVNGNISAKNSLFKARNDQSLTILRENLVAETISAELAKPVNGPWDIRCKSSKTSSVDGDLIIIETHVSTGGVANITCVPPGDNSGSNGFTFRQYLSITTLMQDKIPSLGANASNQITEFEAWWKAAQ